MTTAASFAKPASTISSVAVAASMTGNAQPADKVKRSLSVKETFEYSKVKTILETWEKEGIAKEQSCKDGKQEQFRAVHLACKMLAEDVNDPKDKDNAKLKGRSCIFLCTSSGDNAVQAIALTSLVGRKGDGWKSPILPDYLKIFWIITNPHNIRSQVNAASSTKIKGAGTAMIAYIARACLKDNLKGMVGSVLDLAKPFFEKMKFQYTTGLEVFCDYLITSEEIRELANAGTKPYSLTCKPKSQTTSAATGTAITAANASQSAATATNEQANLKTADAKPQQVLRTLKVIEAPNKADVANLAQAWQDEASEKKRKAKGDIGQIFEDAYTISKLIKQCMWSPDECLGTIYDNVYECSDNFGIIQGYVLTIPQELVSTKSKYLGRYLKIAHIVTNPKNVRSDLNNGIKSRIAGAGRAMISHVAELCLKGNFEGIYAEGTGSAKKFYEKFKFTLLDVIPFEAGTWPYHITTGQIKALAKEGLQPYASIKT